MSLAFSAAECVLYVPSQTHHARSFATRPIPAEPDGGGRGFYASDLWNIKYLRHFKWHHLTEKIGAFGRAHAA